MHSYLVYIKPHFNNDVSNYAFVNFSFLSAKVFLYCGHFAVYTSKYGYK